MTLLHSKIASRPPRYRWPIRFLMRWYGIGEDEILNGGEFLYSVDVSQLKQLMNRLKGDGIDVETGRVDYVRLADSPLFVDYVNATRALQQYDLDSLKTDGERKSFWINLYNLLTIHGVIAYRARRSITEIKGAFQRIAYRIGGYRYSLDDIEHGILRANAGHPFLPGPQFTADDPRASFVVIQKDPRIHFALVCASRSCPPISFYRAEQLDTQLDLATRNFINNGGAIVDKMTNSISLSRIFQWYSADFGGRIWNMTPVLAFIAKYLDSPEDRDFITAKAEQLKISYQHYDWTLNG